METSTPTAIQRFFKLISSAHIPLITVDYNMETKKVTEQQIYLEYYEYPNLLQLVREIPWGHNINIMTKVKNMQERDPNPPSNYKEDRLQTYL